MAFFLKIHTRILGGARGEYLGRHYQGVPQDYSGASGARGAEGASYTEGLKKFW